MIEKYIIGHGEKVIRLEQDVEENNIAQAYLFTGHAHIGKMTIASRFSQYLFCSQMCGKCSHCLQILGHTHPDTFWVGGNDDSISIETVRKIIHFMSQTSVSGRKICVIGRVGRLTHPAANALLKILEEPPQNAHFIMTATHVHTVLPTIVSRARVLRFNLVPNSKIVTDIKKIIKTPKDLQSVLGFVNGRPGRLIKLLEDPESFDRQQFWYKKVEELIKKDDIIDRFQFVGETAKEEQDVKRLLINMLYYVRSNLRAGEWTTKNVSLIKEIERAQVMLKANVNTKLVLENLMLEIT